MPNLEWELLKEEHYKAGFRKLVRRIYRLPDGLEQQFDLYGDGDVATAIALTPDQHITTSKQYRPGPSKVLNELIGGFIDKGESPTDAITRELLEETGYRGDIEEVGATYFGAYSISRKHIFLIINCRKVQEPHREESEQMEIELLDLGDFEQRVLQGQTTDMDAVLLALQHIKSQTT